ncbi:MAG: CD225/dispanin family protein [Hamadaea sp.]|uniref:CD225/dispanin family protein n=1 Tax=Hamadaea sp. TaxID=2024425 RepID=UPI00182A37F1|nr:CD225/dispanin family protein [Hamadaea sp.]NUR71123.1 CD225/dispanin family protein [Hamadaea sp.]NUT23371.1 CD225/dispanin family protein [Hamadaea sp.]
MTDPYGSPSYRTTDTSPGLWLGLSIAATLFCCMPLGIVGIVFAAMAMDANSRGDYGLAEERAARAKNWTIGAIVLGLIVLVLYICLVANRVNASNY